MFRSATKFVIHHLPFKKQIFTFMRNHFSVSQKIYKHLYFKGEIEVRVDKQHSFKMMHHGYELENDLFWKGTEGWEKYSLGLWKDLSRTSKVILDIGANTGVYALMSAAVNPLATIIALEPIKRVFEKLLQNVALNDYNIICKEVAASDADGSAVIYDNGADHLYSVTVNKNTTLNPQTKSVTIKTCTLKSLVEEYKLPVIDLIKIDVETHEPEVLKGMAPYLYLYKPTMLIELLNDDISNQVYEIIKGIDYVYFYIDEDTGIEKVDNLYRKVWANFLICSAETAKKLNLL